jgi:hypothetical protein
MRIVDAILSASTMRTTVDLDEDVLRRLKEESSRRRESLRVTLNSLVREGLAFSEKRREEGAVSRFRVRPFSMGLRRGLSYDSVSELLAIAEGEDAR